MLEEDLEDTHLCIKCSSTIVGIENYIQHRKSNCTAKATREIVQVDHPYGAFDFSETTSFHKTEEVEKNPKPHEVTDTYDLLYNLGADVFFSSLELQSSSKRTPATASAATTSGKPSTTRVLTRKATAAIISNQEQEHEDEWIESGNNSENLMKAVRDISGNKKCDSSFKIISFQHDTPEQSEFEDEDDEDFEGVPSHHTGGKWKPDNSPTLRSIVLRNSPAWDDRHQWEITDAERTPKTQEQEDFEQDLNPPPGHTKGKWVPGTKIVRLDFKEDVEIEKIYTHQYWCNTCNRKLSSKLLYERHLKSNLHVKRAEPEQHLEQATLKSIIYSERPKKPSIYLNQDIYLTEQTAVEKTTKEESEILTKEKRKRQKYFIKCETCKVRLPKYLLGKHLISHYHYRRMILNPPKSLDIILDNMHRIVLQAPFQCQPCRFYANTEADFISHWNSNEHQDVSEGPGRFWCSFCKFECEDNNQMRRHLLGPEHKEIILAINRSVPITIGKKIIIQCNKCQQTFRYNIELKKHAAHCTSEPVGTASNEYQSKFVCKTCEKICKSRLSLQRHEIRKHQVKRFFCSACKINFKTKDEAAKHRNSLTHKLKSNLLRKNSASLVRKCNSCEKIFSDLSKLKEHIKDSHPEEKSSCAYCGESFIIPQELGRHVRDKVCRPSTSKDILEVSIATPTKTAQAKTPTLFAASSLEVETKTIPEAAVEFLVAEAEPNSTTDYAQKTTEKLVPDNAELIKEWRCPNCPFTTNLKAEFMFHELLHTAGNVGSRTKLPCPICNREFRKHSLRCHIRQHTNEKVFECKECPLKFSRKYNLKSHMVNIHKKKEDAVECKKIDDGNVKSYTCETCSKVFNKKFSLQQHTNIHKERDKRFSCPMDFCIFIGRTAAQLRRHLTVHETDKIFKCEFNECKYIGKSEQLLKRHAKKHLPAEREYKCPKCDFKTRISGHLNRHVRIHTGEKPYRCPHCEYACNTSENLRKHVVTTSIHPGKCLYECKFCVSSSMFKTNFQKEYRTHLVLEHRIETDLNDLFSL